MANYCQDCGCKVFNRKCTNCHEELYILEQYQDLEMDLPNEESVFMKKVKQQQNNIISTSKT